MPDRPPIRYHIKKKSQPGPNLLWVINRPDGGLVGQGHTFPALLQNVINYRKANGLPIGLNFEDTLEQACCQQYPECCDTVDPRAPLKPRQLRHGHVIAGTRVMLSHIANMRELVPADEAERRAAICAKCPFNVRFTRGCMGVICGFLKEAVTRIVGGGATSLDDKLESCFICKCFLRPAVWVPREIQWDPLPDYEKQVFMEQAPAGCWKKPQ